VLFMGAGGRVPCAPPDPIIAITKAMEDLWIA